MMRAGRIGLTTLLLCCSGAITRATGAEEEPTFRIEFRDGAATPNRIEVPAKTRIRLELVNAGDAPAEFESAELRKEKVLAPHSSTVMVLRSLEPGEYAFFDDFHPGAPAASLIAK